MSFLKGIIGRVIAGPIAAAAGWVVGVAGLPVEAAAEATTAVVGAVTLVVYGVGHKLLDGILSGDDE